jgi:uncharacterized coiled-coil DUF342 family protein
MEFEHESALADYNTSYSKMPLPIKGRIQNFERVKENVYSENPVDPAKERSLKALSAVIANEIQDYMEKDLPDYQEEQVIPKSKNMLSDADKARAKAVQLDENTATIEQIEAKEKQVKAEADHLAAQAKINNDDDEIVSGLL